MSKSLPARYCTTNWSSNTASLRKRVSLLIWLDKDMTWLAPHDGSPGRRSVFSAAYPAGSRRNPGQALVDVLSA